ncbi:MAG: T9SS type A sorting domain-containing protein [Bacteroidetes bacterium]|nr:T9SS type A sorting domain-containing protein [Bacteroidota bacterium]
MHSKLFKLASLFVAVLLCYQGFSQSNLIYGIWEDPASSTYYFVSVDPATANKTNIASIPGMTGYVAGGTSTINTSDSAYSFMGSESGVIKLYQIDIQTGNVLNKNTFSFTITGHEYNSADSIIYAIWNDVTDYHLVTVDPVACTKTSISTIAGVTAYAIGTSSLDCQHGEYNFMGYMGGSLWALNLDVTTGSILNQNTFTENVIGHRYDTVKDTIYALWEDKTPQVYYLVTFDAATGQFTTVDSITNANPGYVGEAYSYNSSTSEYTFNGFIGPTSTLFQLDANKVSIVNSNPMMLNVVGYRQFNYCGQIQTEIETLMQYDDVLVYPNPSFKEFNIDLGKEYKQISLRIYDLTGQTVFESTYSNTVSLQVPQISIYSGLLLYELRSMDKILKRGRIIIQ